MNPCSRCLIILFTALLLAPSQHAAAQSPYPSPRLSALQPTGGKQGSVVEVTIAGADLDDARALYFSDPGLEATRLPPDEKELKKKSTEPVPIRFQVRIAPDAALGVHDVRLIGRWGISNPRAFVVGKLAEVQESEKNDDVPEAQRVSLGCVVNGVIAAKTDVDYFVFAGKKGQKVVIHCAASSIDSRLTPYVQIFDSAGKELGASKNYHDRDAKLAVALPSDGDYWIRLCEFAYQGGGVEYPYRLTIDDGPWIDAVYPPAVQTGAAAKVALFGANLPGGVPHLGLLERVETTINAPVKTEATLDFHSTMLPRLASVDGFGLRLGESNPIFVNVAEDPIILDNEKNDTPDTAQEIAVPCALCGRVEKRGDRDYFVFQAKKGDALFLEGFADRLRAPVDLYFQIKKVGGDAILGVFDDNSELPASIDRFYTYSDDPAAKFVAPEDGRYELLVRARTAEFRSGPRMVYRLDIRRPRPDFRLVLVGNHESGAGLTLRRGGSHDIDVVCFRQDDFQGDVLLRVAGLPEGVTCPPQVLGHNVHRTSLVLTAAPDAPDWAGPITISGAALIDGKKVVRLARAGCLTFPTPAPNIPAVSRLARSICLAVREKAAFRLETSVTDAAIPVGGSASFKIKVDRFMPEFKDTVQITAAAGPAQVTGKMMTFPKLGVAPDKTGEMKAIIPNDVAPGDYNVVFRGSGKLSMMDGKKKKDNITFVAVTPAIRLTVFDSVAKLAFAPKLALKPDSEFALAVKLTRLHGYKGDFKLELIVPAGVKGLSAADVTIPAGAEEGKLIIKVTKDAKSGTLPLCLVRATAKLDKVTLKEEAKLAIEVSADAKASAPTAAFMTVKLLSEGTDGWRYATREKIKGERWREPDFDDKDWRAVRTPFGNGEDEIKKRLGTEVSDKGVDLLCRRLVDVPIELLKDKSASFRLLVASDDGATVYINGQPADDDRGDHEFSYWNRETAVPASLLRAGRNVIAVAVHNSPGSSDVYLDLSLLALVPGKK